MYVAVLNKHGKPLMPCSPRTARVLLKQGKAKVVRCKPFTIQLLYGSSGYKQKLYAFRDRGLTQGICICREDRKVIARMEVQGRTDISERLYERRSYRRSRRYRNTGYRQCRSDNRKRREDWLPPSVERLWYEHEKVRNFLNSLFPITQWAEEVNNFDTHKMWNPEVKGEDYQNGPLKGKKDVRQYVLERDSYRCVLCGDAENLEVHHIIPRAKGGSNRPQNLVTLCANCHRKVTLGEIEIDTVIESYRWAAKLNALNSRFVALSVVKVSPKNVRQKRVELGLEKAHWADALAGITVAFGITPDLSELPPLLTGRFVRTKNRQLHCAKPVKSGYRPKAQANRYLKNKQGVRFMRYDLAKYTHNGKKIIGYLNTLRSSGMVRICDFTGRELANVSVNRLKKLQNRDSVIWEWLFLPSPKGDGSPSHDIYRKK